MSEQVEIELRIRRGRRVAISLPTDLMPVEVDALSKRLRRLLEAWSRKEG